MARRAADIRRDGVVDGGLDVGHGRVGGDRGRGQRMGRAAHRHGEGEGAGRAGRREARAGERALGFGEVDVAGLAGHGVVDLRLGDRAGLLGDGFGRLHQLGERGDALVRRAQRLLRLADRVEQGVEVAGAVAEGLRGEEVRRIVERRVDLLASRQTVLGRGHQVGGVLEREQVLPNSG